MPWQARHREEPSQEQGRLQHVPQRSPLIANLAAARNHACGKRVASGRALPGPELEVAAAHGHTAWAEPTCMTGYADRTSKSTPAPRDGDTAAAPPATEEPVATRLHRKITSKRISVRHIALPDGLRLRKRLRRGLVRNALATTPSPLRVGMAGGKQRTNCNGGNCNSEIREHPYPSRYQGSRHATR